MKIAEILTESTKLPTKFNTGDDFMDFVYDKWPSRETHVEHQGSGDWMAEIDGDPKITMATYSEDNKMVSWTDDAGEEIE